VRVLHPYAHPGCARGEREERLYLLDAWRESPLDSPRERAALAWTEALTEIARTHVPDDVYAEAQAHFTEESWSGSPSRSG
jgi:alkylhydroperoxidase family enzyme